MKPLTAASDGHRPFCLFFFYAFFHAGYLFILVIVLTIFTFVRLVSVISFKKSQSIRNEKYVLALIDRCMGCSCRTEGHLGKWWEETCSWMQLFPTPTTQGHSMGRLRKRDNQWMSGIHCLERRRQWVTPVTAGWQLLTERDQMSDEREAIGRDWSPDRGRWARWTDCSLTRTSATWIMNDRLLVRVKVSVSLSL